MSFLIAIFDKTVEFIIDNHRRETKRRVLS